MTLNARFHALLSEMAGSAAIAKEQARVSGLAFVSPSAFVVLQANSPAAPTFDRRFWLLQTVITNSRKSLLR